MGIVGIFMGYIRGYQVFSLSASFRPFSAFWLERSSTQLFLAFQRFHLVAVSSVVFTTKQTLPRKVAFKLNLICTNQGFNKVTLKFQSLLQIHLTSLFTLTLHVRKQPVKSPPTPTPTHSKYYYLCHQFLQYFKLQ